MSKAVKIKIYIMMVKPVVVFGSKTWSMAEMDMERLSTWERKILRRLYGQMVEQGMWRIRTNQEVKELYKDLDKVAVIKIEKIGMNWTCSKSGLGEGMLRKYLRVNWREVEEGEDLV
jgi:hypothetical protein